ncbi:hypothetical protein MTO98_25715 [Mucilaginibacter sp. SMC90]|uniref:hypothetical protein n=1 Tax=Mucilaginibacter sp. SMC90 TaxID=2929803 RepID=UPI001FB2BBE6|nr:hypothetical protein [Mucilaginibacter sp. SMC90]UOE47811.1 hypothetical protein MTO98_25715 [Mucilaginibacter sp. SMC90]
MLNRYYNAVDFNGEELNVMEILAWFKELIYEKGARLSMGEEGLNNISFLGDGRVWFESTGEPATQRLREIAEEFSVGFLHYFGNNSTYGEAVYSQGKLDITLLDEDDLNTIGYDDTAMQYVVGGVPFTNHRQAIDHLLVKKKLDKQYQQRGAADHRARKR